MYYVTATELAKLAKCERQLFLETKYGESTELTARYIERGNHEHMQFRHMITGKKGNWLIRFMRWLLRLLIR